MQLSKILIFRGNLVNMPLLARGELAVAFDQKALYVGDGFTNLPITGTRVADADYGALTVSDAGMTWTLNPGTIVPGDLADIAGRTILARDDVTPGPPAEVSISDILNWLGGNEGDLLYRAAGAWSILGAGNDRNLLMQRDSGGVVKPEWTTQGIAIVRDEKAAGTNGGTFTAGAWRLRDLNTISLDDGVGVFVAGNQFTLPQGMYRIRAYAPASGCQGHQCGIYDSTPILRGLGTSAYNGTSESDNTLSIAYALVGVGSGGGTFDIQHKCETTRASYGFGARANCGNNEVYTTVEIERLK